MDYEEHFEILKQGVAAWNKWRDENPELNPRLRGKDISGSIEYNPLQSDKGKAEGEYPKRVRRGRLFNGDSGGHRYDLRGVNLKATFLEDANLHRMNLTGANLSGANLGGADLSEANLTGARLYRAYLGKTNFAGATLTDANLTRTMLAGTMFVNNDLSTVKGLDSVEHHGPSVIDISTIFLSNGRIHETFLRGVGVPDIFITYMASLTGKPIDFYSCFISYSSRDQEFAQRLYADLQSNGVRCWYAPEALKIGDRLRPRIDESIRVYDKLLIILSQSSIESGWVEQEVESALAKEKEQNRTVLFPIRVDDTVININSGWPFYIKNTRHIGDFRLWKDHDAYSKALERLLRDLKTESNAQR